MENKREKPVGIMGWHQMYNFGTQLQITALTQVVRMMGYYPEVIDYSPTKEMYRIKKNMLFAMLRVLRRVNYMKNPEYLSDARRKIFDSYKKEYFCFSDKCEFSSELYMLNEQYGAFVCGSDQIWNPYYGDDKYFLDFVENSSKKIAYAPSFGVDSLPNNYVLNKYKRLLEGFNEISIREVQGQEVLSRMGISDVPVVLDPVLLLDKEGWNDLLDLQPLQRDDYILCYFLGNIRKYLRYIRKLQKKLQKKVIVIATRNKDLKLPFEIYDEIGPKEFLLLIQGASFICTDSFHGVCFSVIYQKNFWVFERFEKYHINNQNCRIDSILEILGLEYRKKNKRQFKCGEIQVKWQEVEKKLVKLRAKSHSYLQKALQSAFMNTNKPHIRITNSCCGCGACKSICKYNAIQMLKDGNGDLKARINIEQCVQCGACKKVCPFREGDNLKNIECARYYSFKSKRKEVLMRSSSGGASYEILTHLSQQGYILYGCIYDNEIESAVHKKVGKEELCKTQGSKYIHSDTCNVIGEICRAAEKLVFVGTPCQVSAVDKILTNAGIREKAVLVDFICHGVPTDRLWRRYLYEIKEKLHTHQNVNVIFRKKKYGWRKRVMFIEGKEGGKYKRDSTGDLFYCFYNQGNCFEEQCYECKFRNKTAADIRIGDYWGNKYKSDKQGVSRVLSISAKGNHIIESIQQNACINEFPVKVFFSEENPVNPVKPVYYDVLLKDLEKQIPLKKLKKIYCDAWYIEFLYRIKDFILHM